MATSEEHTTEKTEEKTPGETEEKTEERTPEKTEEKTPEKPATSKAKKWPKRVAMVAVGLLVGLVVAEFVFRARDEGAFPHLNAYVADEALGVRLEPGAEGKVRINNDPVTSFRINSDGFRGAELSAPSKDDIVIVGDSQVFGLGVEASESFASRLAEKTSRPVVNAGVPTYGPLEFHALAERLLKERKGSTLVYVLNIGNDLFEVNRPNVQRHAVWDGWAVRKETAPISTTSFPGRRWLYRHSHLVFAWRKFWYQRSHPQLDDASFPSEGGWLDLVTLRSQSQAQRKAQRQEEEVAAALRPAEIAYLQRTALRAQLDVEQLVYSELSGKDGNLSLLLRSARATPGDIVTSTGGEESQPLGASALSVRQGAAYRKKVEKQLLALAAKTEDAAKKKKITDTFARREASYDKLAVMQAAPLVLARATSPLAQPLAKLKKLCDEHEVTLVVLVLPLDVMVSADEWAKYGQEPIDMAGSEVLIEDIITLAEALGVRALDTTEALRAAQPGAFLSDLHLSPKGHDVVATAITAKLAEKPPTVRKPGLPKGRSRMPTLAEFRKRKELLVLGSDAAACDPYLRDEWLMVRCMQRAGEQHKRARDYDPYKHGAKLGPLPLGVRVVEGASGDTVTSAHEGVVTLVTPIFPGTTLVADFFWEGERRQLRVAWPKDMPVANEIRMKKMKDAGSPPAMADASKLCACHQEVAKADHCWLLEGSPDEDCLRTYPDDCQALLACAQGQPLYPPSCIDNKVNGFATQYCYDPCGECKGGRCLDWKGASLCVR